MLDHVDTPPRWCRPCPRPVTAGAGALLVSDLNPAPRVCRWTQVLCRVTVGFVRRAQLAEARKAAGKSQEQVAEALGVHRTQISQWERGDATPHPRQRGIYAEALSISLSELHAMLSSLPVDDEQAPMELKLALAVEQAATEIRSHTLSVVNGLLQTPDYAAAIARAVGTTPTSEDYVARNVEQRRHRQRRVHDGHVELHVIQPEASLRSQLGAPEVMASQMRHLADMAKMDTVTVQVVPFGVGQYEAQRVGTFAIQALPIGGAMVDLDGYGGIKMIDDVDEVAYFTDAFDHACRVALSPQASVEFIRQLQQEWET